MSQDRVRKAFESKLKTWAAAQSPAIPVAWENTDFKPTAGAYIEPSLIPVRTVTETLDGVHRRFMGLFQVSLVMPIDSGPGDAEALVKALDALYPLTTPLTADGLVIVLLQPMSAAPAVPRPDRYVIPVTCSYRADTDA